MKRCLDDKDIVLLAGNQLDKKEIKKLSRHIKSCETCHRKVKEFRQALEELEDSIKYSDRGGS